MELKWSDVPYVYNKLGKLLIMIIPKFWQGYIQKMFAFSFMTSFILIQCLQSHWNHPISLVIKNTQTSNRQTADSNAHENWL